MDLSNCGSPCSRNAERGLRITNHGEHWEHGELSELFIDEHAEKLESLF